MNQLEQRDRRSFAQRFLRRYRRRMALSAEHRLRFPVCLLKHSVSISVYWITIAILAVVVTTAEGSSLAPWQDAGMVGSSVGGKSMDIYADLPPTLFAPNGRLPAVERILQQTLGDMDASGSGTNLVVALQCRDGIAVVTTVPQSPYLYTGNNTNTNNTYNSTGNQTAAQDSPQKEASNSTSQSLLLDDCDSNDNNEAALVIPAPFVSLSSSVWGVTAGNIVHARVVERFWHEIASDMRRQEMAVDVIDGPAGANGGKELTFQTAVLARRWADYVQHGTQHLPGSDSYGLMAVQGIFFSSPPPPLSLSTDDDDNKESPTNAAVIWRVDPSGQFFLCRAAILGPGARSIEERFLTLLAAVGRVSDGSTSSSSKDQPAKQLSTTEIRERLSAWTVEEALGVATDCIRSAETKGHRSSSRSSQAVRPAVRLRGMSLVDGRVTWYNETALAVLREKADWSE